MNEPRKKMWTDVMLKWEFKLTVTMFLSLLAFVMYFKIPDRVHELCLTAMVFSTLGDLFMMNYAGVPQYVFRGEQFYAGTCIFALAHIFYRQMFRALTPAKTVFGLGEIITLVLLVITCVIMYNANLKKRSKVFYAAVGFYTGIILSNLAAAINCAQALGGRYILALIGVISFIISDVFLLIREVKKDTPAIRKLIWVFYPIAQILIIVNV